MANYKKVVEMFGDNLASLLELAKRWLIDWAIKPKELLHALQQVRKEDLLGLVAGTHKIAKSSWVPKDDFKIRKTITCHEDTKGSERSLPDRLKKNGVAVPLLLENLITYGHIIPCFQEAPIDLAVISVKDLGFPNGTHYGAFCSRARQLGLDECSVGDAVQLSLQHIDQSSRKELWIAMPLIGYDDEDQKYIISLKPKTHDVHLASLCIHGFSETTFCGSDKSFVFKFNKK